MGERIPSKIEDSIVYSGNSQTNGWFEHMYQTALPSTHNSDQSIIFGSTVEQRWKDAETIGVQLPETIRNYELVVIGVGPYISHDANSAISETGRWLKRFADEAWRE